MCMWGIFYGCYVMLKLGGQYSIEGCMDLWKSFFKNFLCSLFEWCKGAWTLKTDRLIF